MKFKKREKVARAAITQLLGEVSISKEERAALERRVREDMISESDKVILKKIVENSQKIMKIIKDF